VSVNEVCHIERILMRVRLIGFDPDALIGGTVRWFPDVDAERVGHDVFPRVLCKVDSVLKINEG